MSTCNHIWKNYYGFTDSYYYCEKCDVKSAQVPEEDYQYTFYLPEGIEIEIKNEKTPTDT